MHRVCPSLPRVQVPAKECENHKNARVACCHTDRKQASSHAMVPFPQHTHSSWLGCATGAKETPCVVDIQNFIIYTHMKHSRHYIQIYTRVKAVSTNRSCWKGSSQKRVHVILEQLIVQSYTYHANRTCNNMASSQRRERERASE